MFSEFDTTTSALRASVVVRVLTIPRLGLRHRLGLITIPALRASEGATKSVFQTSEGATSSNLRATRGFVLNVGTHGLCNAVQISHPHTAIEKLVCRKNFPLDFRFRLTREKERPGIINIL